MIQETPFFHKVVIWADASPPTPPPPTYGGRRLSQGRLSFLDQGNRSRFGGRLRPDYPPLLREDGRLSEMCNSWMITSGDPLDRLVDGDLCSPSNERAT